MVKQQFPGFVYCFLKSPKHLFSILLLLLLCLPLSIAQAALTATVDRTSLSISDTLMLTIRSSVDHLNGDIDLTPLQKDFTIINRSRSSKTSYINGKRSSSYELTLTIAPNRTGNITIQPFSFKGEQTAAIDVTVSSTATHAPGSLSDVFLDNQVNKQEVYVQEQILYTLKIYHSVGLTEANLSALEINNAVAKKLGDQKQYESILNGVRYAVIEINYAIFPQASGLLEIPLQTLTARVATAGRNSFSYSYGKMMRFQSPTQVINVLPKPASYPANTPWLPTGKLEVIDSWENNPPALTVGESVTRSLRVLATGLDAGQIPDINTRIDQVKNYPDKPKLNDEISAIGITGEKIQATAYVPQTEGSLLIPAVTIHWWNTTLDQLDSTLIPAVQLEVAPAKNTSTQKVGLLSPQVSSSDQGPLPIENTPEYRREWLWPGLTGLFALLWLATLICWHRSKKHRDQSTINPSSQNTSLADAYKRLQRACNANDPRACHSALVLWFKLRLDDASFGNLADIRALDIHPDLADELDKLEAVLYSSNKNKLSWHGQALLNIISTVKAGNHHKNDKSGNDALPPLYPL